MQRHENRCIVTGVYDWCRARRHQVPKASLDYACILPRTARCREELGRIVSLSPYLLMPCWPHLICSTSISPLQAGTSCKTMRQWLSKQRNNFSLISNLRLTLWRWRSMQVTRFSNFCLLWSQHRLSFAWSSWHFVVSPLTGPWRIYYCGVRARDRWIVRNPTPARSNFFASASRSIWGPRSLTDVPLCSRDDRKNSALQPCRHGDRQGKRVSWSYSSYAAEPGLW